MEAESFSLSESFSPDEYVINIIRRGVLNSQNILIDTPSDGRITLLSGDGEYFSEVEDMQRFCNLPSSLFKVSVFNDEKIN